MNNDMLHFFKPVMSDNTSGSSALLDSIIKVFQTNFGKISVADAELLDVIHQLSIHFQSFPVIQHFLHSITHENNDSLQLSDYIEKYMNDWENKLQKLIKSALEHVKPTYKKILVHSNSSTVIKFLVELKGIHQSRLIQLESRPAYEGRTQAEALLKHGYAVTVVPDAMANLMMQQADLVILGADIYTEDDFINKTGSFQLCLLAKFYKVPVMLVADPRKRVEKKNLKATNYDKLYPGEEVWDRKEKNLSIVNRYFEKIPLDFATIKVMN